MTMVTAPRPATSVFQGRPAISNTEIKLKNEADKLIKRWEVRNQRIEAWYKLRRLKDEWRAKNKQSSLPNFVSNAPLGYFNVARHMLASNPPRPHMEMGDDPAVDQHEKAVGEALVLSIIRQLDERNQRAGKLAWRVEMADQILMGWLNVFVGVFKKEDGSPDFRADIWDNLTVFPEWDEQGLVRVAHIYRLNRAAAEAKAKQFGKEGKIDLSGFARENGIPILGLRRRDNADFQVIDLWSRDGDVISHGMTLNGGELLADDEIIELRGKAIPVLSLPVQGESRTEPNPEEDSATFMMASILAPIERNTKDFNDWVTMIMQTAWRKSKLHYFDKTEDAQGAIEEDDLTKGASVIHLELNEEVGALRDPELPREAGFVFNVLDSQRQNASVPNTIFADVAADTSGFLYQSLQAAAATNIGPYNELQTFALTAIGHEWLVGYRDGDFGEIKVSARTAREGGQSGFYYRDIKPTSIPKNFWLVVETQLAFQRNRLQEISAMRQANQGTPDILDEVTLLDELGNFQDPLVIIERKMEDAIRNSPENLLIQQEAFFRQQADLERRKGNRIMANAYRRRAEQIAQQIAGPPPGAPAPGAPAPGAPPPGQTPNVGIGPEAGGAAMGANGFSPDVLRAALQNLPPQAGGRR